MCWCQGLFVQEALEGKVLVVDDNPLIASVIRSLLAAEHYEVFCCDDGQEAVNLLAKSPVDLIICDVMMPRMGGYEFHDAVRGRAEFSHIPFVFLTALDGDDEKNKGRESGADDYLTKPFDPKELLSLVKGKIFRSKKLRKHSEEKYDTYRKKVLHTLSHEFRTPLVAINTGTELLLEQKSLDADKIKNLVEAIQRGGMRLERLVSDFMLLQQIEAGLAQRLFDTRAVEMPAEKLTENIVNHIKQQCVDGKASFEVISLLNDQKVKIYEPHILDIMGRLISNAIKFSKAPVHFEMGFLPLSDEVAFEVKDRGIGFDPQKIREAVDLFHQIDREKMEQQGSGVGLSIAFRYAKIQGGRLEFERRDGGGGVVTLVLPRC